MGRHKGNLSAKDQRKGIYSLFTRKRGKLPKKNLRKKRSLLKANKKLGYKTVCINLDGTEEHPRDLVLKLKEIQRKIKEEKQQ